MNSSSRSRLLDGAWPRGAAAEEALPPPRMASSTALSALPLPPSALERLEQAQFQVVGDLDGLTPSDLAADLGIDRGQAAAILGAVRGNPRGTLAASSSAAGVPVRDALSLLNEERSARRIITFGRELDALLAGGVPTRQLVACSRPAASRLCRLAIGEKSRRVKSLSDTVGW